MCNLRLGRQQSQTNEFVKVNIVKIGHVIKCGKNINKNYQVRLGEFHDRWESFILKENSYEI